MFYKVGIIKDRNKNEKRDKKTTRQINVIQYTRYSCPNWTSCDLHEKNSQINMRGDKGLMDKMHLAVC